MRVRTVFFYVSAKPWAMGFHFFSRSTRKNKLLFTRFHRSQASIDVIHVAFQSKTFVRYDRIQMIVTQLDITLLLLLYSIIVSSSYCVVTCLYDYQFTTPLVKARQGSR